MIHLDLQVAHRVITAKGKWREAEQGESLNSPQAIVGPVCQQNTVCTRKPGVAGNPMAARLSPILLRSLLPETPFGLRCKGSATIEAMTSVSPSGGFWPPVPTHMVAETLRARFMRKLSRVGANLGSESD